MICPKCKSRNLISTSFRLTNWVLLLLGISIIFFDYLLGLLFISLSLIFRSKNLYYCKDCKLLFQEKGE